MPWPEPVTLRGNHVTLAPLSQEYCSGLSEAVVEGELWKLWYTAIPAPDEMADEIDRRLRLQEANSMIPFVVLDSNSIPVGMTTYMHIDERYRRLEIGSTWYATRVQRSAVNTEAKSLLLQHAFESLGCIAVELRTSFFNQKSRRAIERIGAKQDGILRSHQLHADGTLRDTCVYSIIQSEWPTVKTHLQMLLKRA